MISLKTTDEFEKLGYCVYLYAYVIRCRSKFRDTNRVSALFVDICNGTMKKEIHIIPKSSKLDIRYMFHII